MTGIKRSSSAVSNAVPLLRKDRGLVEGHGRGSPVADSLLRPKTVSFHCANALKFCTYSHFPRIPYTVTFIEPICSPESQCKYGRTTRFPHGESDRAALPHSHHRIHAHAQRPRLESATSSPINQHHYTSTGDVFYLAAVLAQKIMLNHPFSDGNKRASVAAADMFLRLNGFQLTQGEKSPLTSSEGCVDSKERHI